MIAIVFFPKDVMVPMYKFAVWEGVHPMFDEGDFRYDIVQTFGSGAFAVCIVVEVILIGFIGKWQRKSTLRLVINCPF